MVGKKVNKTPTLYIMCGLPFSGKTILAKKLSLKKGFERVDLDEIKNEHGFERMGDDEVSVRDWEEIFTDFYLRIETFLKQGKEVIADVANLEKEDRDRLRTVADRVGCQTCVIFMDIPVWLAKRRWLENRKNLKRFDISEKIFKEAVVALEKPTDEEKVIAFDRFCNTDSWINENFR